MPDLCTIAVRHELHLHLYTSFVDCLDDSFTVSCVSKVIASCHKLAAFGLCHYLCLSGDGVCGVDPRVVCVQGEGDSAASEL